MKVVYTKSIKSIGGRLGKFVLTRKMTGDKAVVRRYVSPILTENNHNIGNVVRNMSALWKTCSEGFKRDLKTYTIIRKDHYSGDEIAAHTNFAHFIRIMYRFKVANPEIELKTVTKEGLETAGIPTTVADIVKEGLLEPISGADALTEEW